MTPATANVSSKQVTLLVTSVGADGTASDTRTYFYYVRVHAGGGGGYSIWVSGREADGTTTDEVSYYFQVR